MTVEVQKSERDLPIPGFYPDEPQLLGLIDQVARDQSILDPRSFVSNNGSPIVVPIEYNTEANQDFFEGEDTYFIDWYSLGSERPESLISYIGSLSSGARLMLEIREGDTHSVADLKLVAQGAGRRLDLDKKVLDVDDGSMAAVRHYLSPNRKIEGANPQILTLQQARDELLRTGEWQKFLTKGVDYVNGSSISPELLDKLWTVYDKTFDKLVENHPSAQKQPRDYFEQQILLPESGVVYVEQGDMVTSALFLIEDVMKCPWLNGSFYREKYPVGKTVFISGVSTSLDLQGMHLSELTMGATGKLGEIVPAISATATQCTNRSARYIPRLAKQFTQDSVQLDLQEQAAYEYPVFILN